MSNNHLYSNDHGPWPPSLPPPPSPAYFVNGEHHFTYPQSIPPPYWFPPLPYPSIPHTSDACPTCGRPYSIPPTTAGEGTSNEHETEDGERTSSEIETEVPEASPEVPTAGAQGVPQPRRTVEEKLTIILDIIGTVRWNVGDFMYHLFRLEDDMRRPITRDPRVRQVVAHFLQGYTSHTAGEVLRWWIEDPAGRPKRDTEEYGKEFSVTGDYWKCKYARVAITTAAASLVREELEKEIRSAVKSDSGLSGSTTNERGRREITWIDIGPETVKTVRDILQAKQPLTWYLIYGLCSPRPRMRKGELTVRQTRPADITATEVLSSINFSRTGYARLLPAARSMLYFATGASALLFHSSSREGHTLSWNTTHAMLKHSAQRTAAHLVSIGRSATEAPIIRTDNVQMYHRQREQRIGRKNQMKVGMSAFAADLLDFDAAALDLDDKLSRIAENKRKDLTVSKLLGFLDTAWFDYMGHIQWLQALVNTVPQLHKYKPRIEELLKTEGARLRLPVRKTDIYSMQTVAENEAVTVELKNGLFKFLEQLGQRDGDFNHRLLLVGGDGMTFEKILTLKNYMQFQTDSLRRLDIVEPFLEIWHTLWTNLCAIFETHWGEANTRDPSRLGHNAAKIGQKAPPDLRKVDYYPASYLAYLVLDARMLDCWRLALGADDIFTHFENLGREDRLPSFEDLRSIAKELHQRYTTRAAYVNVMRGKPPLGVPVEPGSWTPPEEDVTSQSQERDSKKEPTIPFDEVFKGDQTLAQSMMFMHTTMLSRESVEGSSSGDIGRCYECLKYMLFTFAGSAHHPKYATYLLEQITRLELESSPALKNLFLRNWVVNPSGKAGHWVPGDLTLEQRINGELEDYLSRKGGEWDDEHISEIVAPNIPQLAELKNNWGTGVGLARRRSRHTAPHSRPEMRILLSLYKETKLHSFRQGRFYDRYADDVDLFTRGVRRLAEGKLKDFTEHTTSARNLSQLGTRNPTPQDLWPEYYDDNGQPNDGDRNDVNEFDCDAQDDDNVTNSDTEDVEGELEVPGEQSQEPPRPRPRQRRAARGTIAMEDGVLTVDVHGQDEDDSENDSADDEDVE